LEAKLAELFTASHRYSSATNRTPYPDYAAD
jgi:hypothetical protein